MTRRLLCLNTGPWGASGRSRILRAGWVRLSVNAPKPTVNQEEAEVEAKKEEDTGSGRRLESSLSA